MALATAIRWLPTLKELMGHRDIKTTMRYVTVTGAQLDQAIAQAFGQKLGKKTG